MVLSAASVSAQPRDDIAALARTVAVGFAEQGALAEREGRPIAAEREYARAVDADRTYLEGYLGLARALQARRRVEEAASALEAASSSVLFDDESAARWARAMAALGALDRALRALAARVESARNERLLAELCAASGRLPEALAHARRATDLARGDPSTERETRRLSRALEILTGELDPVRAPPPSASALRRILARSTQR